MSQDLTRHDRRGLRYFRGGDGPSILLLHGLAGSAHSWEKAGRILADRYDVIIPDLSGFGESTGLDRALHLDHDFYVEAHAEAMHQLLHDLDIQTLFVGGHDFGVVVALTLLRLFPNLTIEGLALAAPDLFADAVRPWPSWFARLPGLSTAIAWGVAGNRIGLRMLYRAAVHDKIAFPMSDFERHLTPSGITQTRRIARRRLAAGRSSSKDLQALLSHLDVPTLVLVGDRDPFCPLEDGNRLVNTLPNAAMSLLRETGHFVPEERPEVTAWHVDDLFRARSQCPTGPVGERWRSCGR